MEIDFVEIRALYFLWKLRDPLRCEGERWSFYREPTVAISRARLDSMIQRGWLQRTYRLEIPEIDDYELTVYGLQAAQGYEGTLFKEIAKRIQSKL